MRNLLAVSIGVALVLTGGAPRAETPMGPPGFCEALDRFASASPGDRAAVFFWSPSSDDEINMYAPMGAKPMDAVAKGLYAAYGHMTHYILLTDLKTRLGQCSSAKRGLVRLEASQAACEDRASLEPCLSIRRVAPH